MRVSSFYAGLAALKRVAVVLSLALALPVASLSASAGEEPGPGVVIKRATDEIMALVAEAPSYFDEDPERYFSAVGAELDKVVDFRGFARGIMGKYASSAYYRSLDKAGQETLRGQLDRFAEVVRRGLIQTYSRGLLAFGGSEVELKDVELAPESTRVASVTQLVRANDGRVYTLKYQMGQYQEGQWRLRNMIIENINLGEIYRGQFEASVAEADGDIEAVIDQWNTVAIDDAEEEES